VGSAISRDDIEPEAEKIEEVLKKKRSKEDAHQVYEMDVVTATRSVLDGMRLPPQTQRGSTGFIGSALDDMKHKSVQDMDALTHDFLSCSIYEPFHFSEVNG